MIGVTTFPRLYRDSVTLMALAARLEKLDDVERAGVMMATPANLEILVEAGLVTADAAWAPDDLVVAVRAATEDALEAAANTARSALSGDGADSDGSGTGEPQPTSITEALDQGALANLACISVPGDYAASVVADALHAGLHVFCFSDNVALDDEIRLKALAVENRLLLMGPDCGTALVDGVGLGFVNEVRPGPVGIVSASGTGAQEVACLLDHTGVGISQILGVGGRDLSAAVGASMTRLALDLLDDDPDVTVLVLVSKPPAPEVAERVLGWLAERATQERPVIACLLGVPDSGAPGQDPLIIRGSLERAAAAAAVAAGCEPVAATAAAVAPARQERQIVGLFTGGTLAHEATLTLAAAGATAEIHDLGDDQYTQGRPHPMIDPTARAEWIHTLTDHAPGVLLVDVVLGHGSHTDPAGELVAAVQALRDGSPAGDAWRVVATVTGTDSDPQHFPTQVARLTEAGIDVHPSTAAATRAALALSGDNA
ncbi:MAG: FdrA family protein [Propioniciclava sp.]